LFYFVFLFFCFFVDKLGFMGEARGCGFRFFEKKLGKKLAKIWVLAAVE
jgi:hypothetical protein